MDSPSYEMDGRRRVFIKHLVAAGFSAALISGGAQSAFAQILNIK